MPFLENWCEKLILISYITRHFPTRHFSQKGKTNTSQLKISGGFLLKSVRLFTLADTKNGHKIRLTQFSHRTVMNYDFRPLFCKFSNGITKKSCLTVFNNYNPSRLLSVLYLSLTSKIRPSFGPISPLPTLRPNCPPAPAWPEQPKIRRPPYGFSTLLWTCLAGILISVGPGLSVALARAFSWKKASECL